MDDFEKNIKKNTNVFGGQQPNREKMWTNIEKRLPAQEAKRIPLWKNTRLRFAAGFALLFGLASLIYFSVATPSNSLASAIPTELLEINMHYKKLVDFQLQQLQANAELSAAEKKEFVAYISELEEENDYLKNELINNLDNQEVLEAIVTNYKKQIELIERLLLRLNHSQKEKKDEGITI